MRGIAYTVVSVGGSSEYRLMSMPGERRVDDRGWDLTDSGEAQAAAAARRMASNRGVKYLREAK